MSVVIPMDDATQTIHSLAPEDIDKGMFVAVKHEVHEMYNPCDFSDSVPGKTPKPIMLPCRDCSDGEPRRVIAVCLPFVYVENASGYTESFDVRRHVLVRVSDDYALEVFTRPTGVTTCY